MLSNHHLDVLVEKKVFGFDVRRVGTDGYGQALYAVREGYDRLPIREWSTDLELAKHIVERYRRRGIKITGEDAKEICIKALHQEEVYV